MGAGNGEFYVDAVLPALAAGLDTAFPELAWERMHVAGSPRRAALALTDEWLVTLPARLAVEQEDAVRHVGDGYASAAAERAFRVRFWGRREQETPEPGRRMGVPWKR